MSKYISSLKALAIAALTLMLGLPAVAADGDLFEYPKVPEDKNILSERCNYLVYHFWDKANLTTVFSSKQKLHNTLGDWFGFMPYATADTVHMAIDKLIEKVSKNGPNTLTLAEMAEAWVYSDTAEMRSEELYLPFAKAAATHKKIGKAERARLAAQVKVIESSAVGATVDPALRFKDRNGSGKSFGDITGESILVGFVDPMCSDCQLDMVRLSANTHIRDMVDRGELTIVLIYPDDSNERWEAKVATMPENWIAGTMPDADEYFDISAIPAYYFLDATHKIIAKNLPVDQVIAAAENVNLRRKK